MRISLDPLDTPKHHRALQGLLDDLNATTATFPGTEIPVTHQLTVHHSTAIA